MRENDNVLQISAIIMAYGSLHYSDISIDRTFELSIKHLHELYKSSGELEYLHVALLHLRAYVQMGLAYDNHGELFDEILHMLGITKKEVLADYVYSNKPVKLTRPQVRSMLGKWMPSAKNPKKIGEVVDEIIENVKSQKKGIYTYSYMSGSVESLYELVISEQECFFHDVRKKRYYFFDIENRSGGSEYD